MKKKVNEIPIKNYIIVAIMFAIVILLTLVVRNWYRSYKQYQLTIPVISGKVKEIKQSEFENYIREHDDFILYIGASEDSNCRSLEKKLISVLNKRDILEEIIYLNITNVDNRDNYLNELYKTYGNEKDTISYPSVIIIKDSKFFDLATKTNKQSLNISEVEKLLDEYEIGNND